MTHEQIATLYAAYRDVGDQVNQLHAALMAVDLDSAATHAPMQRKFGELQVEEEYRLNIFLEAAASYFGGVNDTRAD